MTVLTPAHPAPALRAAPFRPRTTTQAALAQARAQACAELAQARRARDAALQALADIQHRAAMASHDLRQPVHALVLLAEGIALRTNDPALQPAVAQLRRVALSLKSLCDTMLDEDADSRPAQPVSLKTPDLNQLLADVLSTCEESARQRGLRLRGRVSQPHAQIHADPVLLRQALTNLVSNAVRYTRHGGVLVALRHRGDALRLEVHDTGVGIAGEDLGGLFAPYQRGPLARQFGVAGHGLGLAIVSDCARRMGAALGARSVPGRGSCFWLSLPASPAEDDRRIARIDPVRATLHSGAACPQGQATSAPAA